jgi:alkylhydroperoxidase family enzyme
MAHIEVPDGDSLERLRMWQMVPAMNQAVDAFRTAVYEHGTLSVREREVARMRIAQINDCPI